MNRKTLLYLFIGISAFTALYLYYVQIERKKSIDQYFGQPKVGDVYKMKHDDEEGDNMLQYYKVKSIENTFIVFAPSEWIADASVDYIMSKFDDENTIIFSNKDLLDIKNGKWNNHEKGRFTLVEIKRK